MAGQRYTDLFWDPSADGVPDGRSPEIVEEKTGNPCFLPSLFPGSADILNLRSCLTIEEVLSDGPRPSDFDDYDNSVSARIDYGIAKAKQELAGRGTGDPEADRITLVEHPVKQGFAEALDQDRHQQAQALAEARVKQAQNALQDDKLIGPRTQALDWISECRQKEQEARLRGDMEEVHAWKRRAQWGVQDIMKLGKNKAEQLVEEYADEVDFHGIVQLFDKKTVNDEKWDTPRMQHDAGILLARANSRNRWGVVALPFESSPWGEVLPVHPKNMAQVQLPPEAYEKFKTLVYQSGGDPAPKEVFKKSWQVLRTLGYAGTAVPAHETQIKKAEGEELDPNKMSFKDYCAWREKSEKKRKPFVFPKKRHHGG